MDLFPDPKVVRDVQKELDALIEEGIVKLTTLLLNSDNSDTGKLIIFCNYIIYSYIA